MDQQTIDYLYLAGTAIASCCFCGAVVLIPLGINIFVARILAKPLEFPLSEMPDSFRERCPMCGSRRLKWGTFFNAGVFAPYDRKGVWGVYRSSRRRTVAAKCEECGYIMRFEKG